ncbi:phosphatidylserine synthase 2-like isoform X2 [Halichondria panicea]|uniref:phosphatidylserine synthase 2-like isoform X2 n=1 Tax=Halichondria panicea TaxID=6063 RepID=UPI00312B6D65
MASMDTRLVADQMANGGKGVEKEEHQQVYDDGTNTFFWQAHTISAGVLIGLGLIYVALFEQPHNDTMFNIQRGVVAVVIVFILIGMIHMPNGPFVRPHPALWRLVLCVLILYVLLLIFLLFQTTDDSRRFLTLIDSNLGKPLKETNYAVDCRVYAPDHPNGPFSNIMEKMDVFVLCHFFGWWGKAVIIRDWFLLTVLSIGFELVEYTLEVHLPNFGECWWDHWIMDALVCNSLGILCGMLTCEYLEMKTYQWRGLWKTPTLKGKMKRFVGQFMPYSWTSYRWAYTESFGRFSAICLLTIWFLMQEVNTFYLKAILWYPPEHMINVIREIIYGFGGACATHEIYEFLSTKDKNARVGRYVWLTFVAIFCEALLIVKMGWDVVTIPLPRTAVVFWTTLAGVFLIWVVWHFTLPFKHMPIIGPHYRRAMTKLKSS